MNTTLGLAGEALCANDCVTEASGAKINVNIMKSDFRFQLGTAFGINIVFQGGGDYSSKGKTETTPEKRNRHYFHVLQ